MRGWRSASPSIGAPFYYYRPAPVYYPPPVYMAPPPVTYIQQPPVPQGQGGDWYYCPQYRAYYPQVQSCPGAWQLVPPQPQVQAAPPAYP